jgi:hypothetical protein
VSADAVGILRAVDVGSAGSERHRRLVATLCRIARLSLDLPFPSPQAEAEDPGRERPKLALGVVERWARGDPGVRTADVKRVESRCLSPAVESACAAARYTSPARISAAAVAVVESGVLALAGSPEERARLEAEIGRIVRGDWPAGDISG